MQAVEVYRKNTRGDDALNKATGLKVPFKVGWLLTHPIQYISPLLTYLERSGDFKIMAYYQSGDLVHGIQDKGFGSPIRWDIPLLEGYEYCFLPALGRRDQVTYIRPFNYGLSSRLRNDRLDALVVLGYNRPYHWFAMRKAHHLGIRVFVRDDANLFSKHRSESNVAMKRRFFCTIDRYVSGYLSVGRANYEYYRAHGISERKIFHVPWAIDNDFFRPNAQVTEAEALAVRQRHGIEPDAPCILFVGKLIHKKAVLDLLNAFDRLPREENRGPYLVLVGDGELRFRVEEYRRRNPRIIVAGFRNQTELPGYYATTVTEAPSNSCTIDATSPANPSVNTKRPALSLKSGFPISCAGLVWVSIISLSLCAHSRRVKL